MYEEYYNTTIPKGLVIMHDCDNPSCINIEHLRIGTDLDNTRDKILKGRGNREGTCVLKLGDIVSIKSFLEEDEYSKEEIAEMFEIDVDMMNNIVSGKIWEV